MPKSFVHPHIFQNLRIRNRGYIPHWEAEEATYFITYRLSDSLPSHIIARLNEEKKAMQQRHSDMAAVRAAFTLRLDETLDRSHGMALLRDPRAIG